MGFKSEIHLRFSFLNQAKRTFTVLALVCPARRDRRSHIGTQATY